MLVAYLCTPVESRLLIELSAMIGFSNEWRDILGPSRTAGKYLNS